MSGVINFSVVSSLPGTLAANTEYFVISGSTFTIVKTDASANPSTLQVGSIGPLLLLSMLSTTAPVSPSSGDIWNDSTKLKMQAFVNGINGSLTRTLFVLPTAVTVANTTTETTIASITLPANYGAAVRDIRIGGMGFHSAVSSPPIRIRVYKGSTVLLDTGSINSGNSTNAFIEIRAHLTFESSTSVYSQGFYNEQGGGGNLFPMVNTAPTTISAASEVLKLTIQWGTASASDTITISNMVFQEN